jgi:beta-glucanase (GH16 family)
MESRDARNSTSARTNTRDRFAFRHGRIEARIKLPKGQGLWPAFWLLPQEQAYGTWAASGEIDIVEARNPGPTGGNFPGPSTSGTVFPVTLEVDYVRVYSGTR